MVAITQDVIRELAGYRSERGPVTSCYLEVDGGRSVRHTDLDRSLERLVRSARDRFGGAVPLAADLAAMQDHVRGMDRSGVRGLAMFSCSPDRWWRVLPLPVPVRDQVVVQAAPAVAQLEHALEDHCRFGVLLVDRQRARVFVYEMGELVESTEVLDALPRGEDDDHSYTRERGQAHLSAVVAAHLRTAARAVFTVFQQQGFERLILGVPDELASELDAVLHPYVRSRVEARCSIPVGATDGQIRAAAHEVEAEVERRKEDEAVRSLRELVGAGGRAAAGLDDTLRALGERRVATLLVSSGHSAPGWHCPGCDTLGRVGRSCRSCGAPMDAVPDVVEQAVDDALTSGCRVEVCLGNADLDVLGGIGALLRY